MYASVNQHLREYALKTFSMPLILTATQGGFTLRSFCRAQVRVEGVRCACNCPVATFSPGSN